MIMHTPKIDLYPHNQETYDRIIEMWKTSNRVAVIQATGTGKTYLMLRCMVDFEPSKKVVLAPSNYILDQLLSKANGNLPNTELLTYAKLAFMTKEEIAELNPSLIVLDEFHRCGADKWELGVDMLIKMFPNAKILGTSATPIRYLDNARDMSDELFEGNIAVNLSLSDAIVKGILPMPKYISALYTFDEEINNLQAKIERSKNDEETKKDYLKEVETLKNKLNKSKGIPEILKKHISNVGGKFIVFCKNIQHLNEMESTVIEWFKKFKVGITVEKYRVVTGELENNKEMSAFRENKNSRNIRLLFSIDMLNEGVHIDDVTGVILLRPTISPIIFYQQIGRAIQVGNTDSPLIFDFVNNFNNIRIVSFIADLKESVFKEIQKGKFKSEEIFVPNFTVIDETKDISQLFSDIEDKMLPDWDLMFFELREYKEKNNTFSVSDENKKLQIWVNNQKMNFRRGILTADRVEKLNSISFSWDLLEHNWEKNLYDYANRDKNKPLSTKLADWTSRQRRLNDENLLSDYRKSKLEGIGFDFKRYDEKWSDAFIKMKEYKNINGDCTVPLGSSLYIWANRQRSDFKINKLSNDKLKLLNEIGFVFEQNDELWESNFKELVEYKRINGNCRVMANYIVNELKLGSWVGTQRRRRKNGKLSDDRINKLNEIGFVWHIGMGLNPKFEKEDKQ